jgi:hypothetical protein
VRRAGDAQCNGHAGPLGALSAVFSATYTAELVRPAELGSASRAVGQPYSPIRHSDLITLPTLS